MKTALNQEQVLEALRRVKYPGFSRDIVSFGLVKQVDIDGSAVGVLLEITTANREVGEQIAETARQELRALPGLTDAHVQLRLPTPTPGQATPNPAASPTSSRPPGVRRIIAVASGKGGVGKSTVAVNLACALRAEGARTGLLDCDIYGPSIPLMMGIKQAPGVSEDEQFVPVVAHGVSLMSIGFLIPDDQPVIWRGPMIKKTIDQFIHQVAWGELDYLLVDLPPGTGDAQLSLCQTVPLDGGVIVTTPQEASVGVVRRGMIMFEKVRVPLLGLIENMSYFTDTAGSRVEIFGHGGGRSEAERKGIPFLGEIPIFQSIREGGDRGAPVVASYPQSQPAIAFQQVARKLTESIRNRERTTLRSSETTAAPVH